MDTPDVVFKILKQLISLDKNSFLSLNKVRLVSKLWKSECDFIINNYLTNPKKTALSFPKRNKKYVSHLIAFSGFKFDVQSIGCKVELMKYNLRYGKENTFYIKLESVYGPKTFILLEKSYTYSPWYCDLLKVFTKSSKGSHVNHPRHIFVCGLSMFDHIIDFIDYPKINHTTINHCLTSGLGTAILNLFPNLNYDNTKDENIRKFMFFHDGYFIKEILNSHFLIQSFNSKNEFINEIRLTRHHQIKHFGVAITTIVTVFDDSDELWFIDVPTNSLMFKYSIKPLSDLINSQTQNDLKLMTIQSKFMLIFNRNVVHILDLHYNKSMIKHVGCEIHEDILICVSVIRKKLIVECNDSTVVFKTKHLLPNFPHHVERHDINYVEQIK